jgi:hypothetical protein
MAETDDSALHRKDLAGDDAIQAIADLRKELQGLVTDLKAIRDSAKQSMKTLNEDSSTKKVREETEKLTQEQKELIAIQKQIEKVVAQNSDEYRKHKKVLEEAKKAAKENSMMTAQEAKNLDTLTSSLEEIDQALARNRKEWAKLRTEEQRTSKEGKALLAVIEKQDAASKKLSAQLGQMQKHVGDYGRANMRAAEQTEALNTVTGGLIGNLKQQGKAMLTLATNPYFFVIAAAVGTVMALSSAVKMFFDRTDEGEDLLDRNTALWNAFFGQLKDGWADVGKSIYDFFGGLEEIINDVYDYMVPVLDFFAKFNIVAALYRKLLGDKEDFNEAAQLGIQYSEAQQKLDDEHLKLTIASSNMQRKANKDLEESKNKLLYIDEERLALLKTGIALQEQASDAAIASEETALEVLRLKLLAEHKDNEFLKQKFDISEANLELFAEQITQSNLIGEEQKAIAEQVVKIIDLQAQYYQQRKRGTSQISALTLEIEKTQRDAANRVFDYQIEVSRKYSEDVIKRNDEIIADERSTNGEILRAMVDRQGARLNLLNTQQTQEADLLRRSAEERYRQEGQTNQARIDELLEQDQTYQGQKRAIVFKYDKLYREAIEDGAKGVRVANDRHLQAQLAALDSAYGQGLITTAEYNKQRFIIQRDGEKALYDLTVEALERLIAVGKEQGNDVYDFEKQLNALREAEARRSAAKRLDEERKAAEQLKQIISATLDTVGEMYSNFSQARVMEIDNQLEALRTAYDKEIELAGDNEDAKEAIARNFRQKEAALAKQKKKEQHDAAVFERNLALAKAIINTALAVTEALAAYDYASAVLFGALGALEIATISSQPIPSYAKGTESHPGGLALVGDGGGSEIVSEPGKRPYLTPSMPTIMDIAEGAKVIPHDETMQYLAYAGLLNSMRGDRSEVVTTLDAAILSELEDVNHNLKNIPQPNLVGQETALYNVRQAQQSQSKHLERIAMGKNWRKP